MNLTKPQPVRQLLDVLLCLAILVAAVRLLCAAPFLIPHRQLSLAAYVAAPAIVSLLPRGSLHWEPAEGSPPKSSEASKAAHVSSNLPSPATADPVAGWKAWKEGRPGSVAPWTVWENAVPADMASWIAWRDVATENDGTRLMSHLSGWRATALLVILHLVETLGVVTVVRLLPRPVLPASLVGTGWAFRRVCSHTAMLSGGLAVPLFALGAAVYWGWQEISQTPAAWQPPYFPTRFGPLAFGLVWVGTALIYLRLQVAIIRRLLTRAVARLDADTLHCGRCGYARAPAGVRCPECGWTYSTTERYTPRLLRWPRGRVGRTALEAAFWSLVVFLLNAPYTLALACRFMPDSWERTLAPWLNHYV